MLQNQTDNAIDKNEAPFKFEEIFFSRTDSKGLIRAGNSVFQRISRYEWDELLGKPHNVIRHADMPKGVFYLFWDFLKKGKPIGAYVKNRTKDGKYYWVFAIATPIKDGYLSVRLKPSSDFFPIIQNAYDTLLAFEKDTKASPKESMAQLLSMLKTLGFNSYEEFMSIAIRKESVARDAALGESIDTSLTHFEELAQRATALLQETSRIFSSYEVNQYVPMNLQIQSAQLGEEGKTIGVISNNFSIISAEIRSEIDTFNQSSRNVFDRIYEGQFLLCTSYLQREVCDFFSKEIAGDSENQQAQEMALLEAQHLEYQDKARTSLEAIIHNVNNFREDCRRMKKCAASLEVIRIMGKVDAARLSVPDGVLNGLLDELKTFQASISESLSMIEKYTNSMKYDTEGVVSTIQAA